MSAGETRPKGAPKVSKKRSGKPLSRGRLTRRARDLAKEARTLLKKKGKRVPEAGREAVSAALEALARVLPSRRKKIAFDREALTQRSVDLDQALADHFQRYRKSVTRELIEAIAWAVGLALIIRFFLIEAFSIPSGSMIPTLEIGDHLFVNKIGYGLYWPLSSSRAIEWSDPEPGDIVVFEYKNELDRKNDGLDYIKRVIAGPGQRVRLENHVVHIDGKPIPTEVEPDLAPCNVYRENVELPPARCQCVRQKETLNGTTYTTQHLAGGSFESCRPQPADWPRRVRPRDGMYFGHAAMNPNWPDVLVPEGHVFVMGDNRDRSQDGRFWGFVPFDRVKGSAFLIWWADDKSRLFSWID